MKLTLPIVYSKWSFPNQKLFPWNIKMISKDKNEIWYDNEGFHVTGIISRFYENLLRGFKKV